MILPLVLLTSTIFAVLSEDEDRPTRTSIDTFDDVDVGDGNVTPLVELGFHRGEDLLACSKNDLLKTGAPRSAVDRIELGLLASFGMGFRS